ncbi:MAG TPA: molybdenum cofactor guanylyltransferase, partial [Woeseiaceae bacterium]
MASDAVNGLVLAGGKSRRMGHDKALLRREGSTQLQRTVSLLQRHVHSVFVSTRSDQVDDAERGRFPRIVDRYSDIGPVAGILTALESDNSVAWLVLACDLPNVDDETITYLLQHRDSAKPFSAYRSNYDNLPEPLCAVYEPGALPIVRDFVGRNIICPRKILLRSNTNLLAQPNPAALDNINTPDDLAS